MTAISWLSAIFTFGYLAPWAIAKTRQLPTSDFIFWVNLTMGWTIIGWIWSLKKALA